MPDLNIIVLCIMVILVTLLFSFVVRTLKISVNKKNRKIAGVCAGLAKESDMPIWAVRAFFLSFLLFLGYGLVLYLALWLFMSFPKRR